MDSEPTFASKLTEEGLCEMKNNDEVERIMLYIISNMLCVIGLNKYK